MQRAACVASVSNRVIIARELKEMEDARKHLLRRPFLGVRGEKMGGGGEGGRERSFLSLRSIPFWFPASLFSPEAPDTQPNVTSAKSVCELCDNLYRGSFLRICTSSLRSAFFSKTMIVSWTLKYLTWKKLGNEFFRPKRREKKRRNGKEEIWGRYEQMNKYISVVTTNQTSENFDFCARTYLLERDSF